MISIAVCELLENARAASGRARISIKTTAIPRDDIRKQNPRRLSSASRQNYWTAPPIRTTRVEVGGTRFTIKASCDHEGIGTGGWDGNLRADY